MRFALLCVLVIGLVSSAEAQSKLQWFFKGTAYQTNAEGKTVAVPITEKTLMKDIAQAAGITEYSTWRWAYHIRGSGFGDTASIIDANGNVLDEVFGYFFGEAFGRVAVTNAEQTVERRLDYIYTKQNTHSLGSAFITKRYITPTIGPKRVIIEGEMQWVVQPNAAAPGGKVCVGRFTTGRTLY